MNLIWTPKSGNKGPVLLCSDAVALRLLANGVAIDLDAEQVEKVEAKVATPNAMVPKKKVQTKKQIKK